MPGIKGFLETSFVDWPGRVCAVLFLGGCNLRCPFCHNHPLVLDQESFPACGLEEVMARLARSRQWLGGICVSGGEPTLDPALPGMLSRLKEDGWAVKLDTNGTRPQVLRSLFRAGLVDTVAMDVKAPLVQEKYDRLAGTPVDLEQIRESIRLIGDSGLDHEFRMTVVPGFHVEEDVSLWAETLDKFSGEPPSRLTVQNFNPRSTLDPELMEVIPFPPEVFLRFRNRAHPVEKCVA